MPVNGLLHVVLVLICIVHWPVSSVYNYRHVLWIDEMFSFVRRSRLPS